MTTSTMREAIVAYSNDTITTTINADTPIPTPSANQVLIKVVVSGSNPKDWKIPMWLSSKFNNTNSGDDIAGYIHAAGENVTEFKPGDRVAAFHTMMTPHGSFAEYAISESTTTFHLPKKTSFEEAATIPLAAMTAVIGLFARLGLPERWAMENRGEIEKEKLKGGVIVYGGASAVGAFAIKLLVHANIHPIITVAGKGADFVSGLIDKSKGDVIIDYRKGDEEVVKGLIGGAGGGHRAFYALDCVAEKGSYHNIAKALDQKGGRFTSVLPVAKEELEKIPKTLVYSQTSVGSAHGKPGNDRDLAFAWFRLFGMGLQEGWFSGHPFEVVPGGLEGVVTGLRNLQAGKASAVKYVFKIEDTPGIEKSRI